MKRISWLIAVAAIAAVLGACGGGGNVPSGSTRNYGAPSPAPGDPVQVTFSITIPTAQGSSQGRKPEYVSRGTGSVTVTPAAVNGVPVTSPTTLTVNTAAGSPGCVTSSGNRVCTAQFSAPVGNDAFTVNTYAGHNGTGALLSGGTIVAQIASSGSSIAVSNTVSLTLNPVVAALTLTSSSTGFVAGTASTASVVLQGTDATGAIIVGSAPLSGSASISLAGSGSAFTVSPASLTQLNQSVSLVYDGDTNVGASVTVEAAVANSPLTASLVLPISRPATPTPSPRPSGAPTAAPEIYVLNQGNNGGLGATVTTYDLAANGNAAPRNVLQLNPNLTAQSLYVDANGTLYVGFQEGEIDEYPIGATAQATPSASITGPDPSQQTIPAPAVITLDPSGDLVTLGFTNLNNNQGALAAIVYAPGASGAATPINAWNFNSPYINTNGFVAGLATDAAGNFYVDGALAQSQFSTVGGIFIAPASANNPFVNASRTIPGSAVTTIPAQIPSQGSITGLALDPSGRIYEAQYTGTGSAQSGAVNVFAAGATGGTTNVPPVQTLTGSALNVNLSQLSTLPIALYSGQLIVANGTTNSILVYPASASGSQPPAQTITGAATQLAGPIAIAAGLEIPATNARVRKSRVLEGRPAAVSRDAASPSAATTAPRL